MIGVADVLEVELPVVMQDLRRRPQDLRFAVQYPVDSRPDQVADIVSQWRCIRRQCAKNKVSECVHAKLLQAVLFEVEALGHPATPGDTSAKGDALEVSFEVVT